MVSVTDGFILFLQKKDDQNSTMDELYLSLLSDLIMKTNLLLGQTEAFEIFECLALNKLHNFMGSLNCCTHGEFLPLLEEIFNFYLCCMDESQFLIDGVISCENHFCHLPNELVYMHRHRFKGTSGDNPEGRYCLFSACIEGFWEHNNKLNVYFENLKQSETFKFATYRRSYDKLRSCKLCVDALFQNIICFQMALDRCFKEVEELTIIEERVAFRAYNCGACWVVDKTKSVITFSGGLSSWSVANSLWQSMSYSQRLELKSTVVPNFFVESPKLNLPIMRAHGAHEKRAYVKRKNKRLKELNANNGKKEKVMCEFRPPEADAKKRCVVMFEASF